MSGGEKVRAGGSLADGLFVLAAAVVALVLGYIGLSGYLSHLSAGEFGTSWPDIAYYDLQMFVLGSAPLSGPGPFPVVLQIARFLAPAVTVHGVGGGLAGPAGGASAPVVRGLGLQARRRDR